MGGFNTSVAMPSNAALEIRPPQSQSPLEIAAGMQEQRLRQQQIQGAQMENQQRQMDLQDQQVARQAYMDSGGDMNKFQQLLMQRGASPKLVTQMQQQMLTTRKTLAETDKVKLENDAARHDQARGELSAFEALPADQKEARYQPLLNSMHQRGLMNDQEYSDFTQQHPTYPGSDDMKFAINHFATGAQLAKEAIEQQNAQSNATSAAARQTGAATGQTKEAREAEQQQFQNAVSALGANPPQNPKEYEQRVGQLPPAVATRILNAVPPGQYDPAKSLQTLRQLGMTPEQQTQAGQSAMNAAETRRHNAVEEGQGAGRLSVERENAARQQKQFDATYGALLGPNGEQLSPEAQKAMASNDPVAVSVASYRTAPPPMQTRGGVVSPLMRKVLAIDPSYDGTQFPARNKTALAYSPGGQEGQNLKSADTALAHLNTISEAGKALASGDLKRLNAIANFLGAEVGGSAQNTYDTIVSMVAPEISKAVIGGVGGEGERQSMAKQFSSSLAPDVREKAIGAAATLLGARIQKSAHAYEQQMGKPLAWQLSDESKQVLNRYSQPAGGAPAAGSKTYTQADVNAAVSAHPGLTAQQAEAAFKAKGWTKQ